MTPSISCNPHDQGRSSLVQTPAPHHSCPRHPVPVTTGLLLPMLRSERGRMQEIPRVLCTKKFMLELTGRAILGLAPGTADRASVASALSRVRIPSTHLTRTSSLPGLMRQPWRSQSRRLQGQSRKRQRRIKLAGLGERGRAGTPQEAPTAPRGAQGHGWPFGLLSVCFLKTVPHFSE